jgi:hypothetical protein
MAITYAEYLKSLGVSDEDIKTMTEGPGASAAKRAFDKLQSDLATEHAARESAEAGRVAYEASVDEWHKTKVIPEYQTMQNELIRVQAEEARAKQVLRSIQERGLIDVAKDLGYDPAPPTHRADPNPNPNPSGFDPTKYLTKDQILEIAQGEGEAIAVAQDIAYEHRVLFPDRPLNFRDLRKRAVAAKKPVEQLWMEEFGVSAARQAKLDADKTTYETRLRKEGADAERAKFAEGANPFNRPFVPSVSPLAARPVTGRDKMPWELGDGGDGTRLQADRVTRATQKVLNEMVKN